MKEGFLRVANMELANANSSSFLSEKHNWMEPTRIKVMQLE